MANENENTTNGTETEKVPIQSEVETPVRNVIDTLAAKDERSRSNMVARLLKTHPQVAELLEGETAGATA